MRVMFMAELVSDMAFISVCSGTMSDNIAWRLGMFNAMSEPFTTPMTSSISKVMTLVTSSVATSAVTRMLPP